MALTLQVSCSYHQEDDGGYGKEAEINLETIDKHTAKQVKDSLESQGWVVQFNGDNMDTYCSKECAK